MVGACFCYLLSVKLTCDVTVCVSQFLSVNAETLLSRERLNDGPAIRGNGVIRTLAAINGEGGYSNGYSGQLKWAGRATYIVEELYCEEPVHCGTCTVGYLYCEIPVQEATCIVGCLYCAMRYLYSKEPMQFVIRTLRYTYNWVSGQFRTCAVGYL